MFYFFSPAIIYWLSLGQSLCCGSQYKRIRMHPVSLSPTSVFNLCYCACYNDDHFPNSRRLLFLLRYYFKCQFRDGRRGYQNDLFTQLQLKWFNHWWNSQVWSTISKVTRDLLYFDDRFLFQKCEKVLKIFFSIYNCQLSIQSVQRNSIYL